MAQARAASDAGPGEPHRGDLLVDPAWSLPADQGGVGAGESQVV